MQILMVCLGNICRSPLAEGILKKKIVNKALPWHVDSCGTANYHVGNPPDYRMIATAKKFGTDISGLRARQFSLADFRKFDVIYAMDSNNYAHIVRLAKSNQEKNKVRLLLNDWQPNKNLEVPDPYYGTEEDFNKVYSLLDEALDHVVNKLISEK
jgi:protein-tyrosine phosphatase